jgi:hypothetical protein
MNGRWQRLTGGDYIESSAIEGMYTFCQLQIRLRGQCRLSGRSRARLALHVSYLKYGSADGIQSRSLAATGSTIDRCKRPRVWSNCHLVTSGFRFSSSPFSGVAGKDCGRSKRRYGLFDPAATRKARAYPAANLQRLRSENVDLFGGRVVTVKGNHRQNIGEILSLEDIRNCNLSVMATQSAFERFDTVGFAR